MSTLTAAILVLVGGAGVVLFYQAFARGLKFRDDFVDARRDDEADEDDV